MSTDLTAHALGTTTEFGIAGIGGEAVSVLSFDALSAGQSVWLQPEAEEPVTEWVLAMDLYIPAGGGSYAGLIQTGSGDADLFLKSNGDGTAGIGTMAVYSGAVAYDAWNRIVISVAVEDGDTVMRKFVNGTLVGTQNLGDTDRWAIDPDLGLKLFTDNDGETNAGYVSSILLMTNPPAADVVAAIVASAPEPSADGFFAVSPAEGAIEVDFTGETVNLRYGDAAVALQGSDYATIATLGESRIGMAAQLGIAAPGADVPVLAYQAFAQDEGIRITLPEDSTDLTSFTMVWDIMTTQTGGYQALLQLGAENTSDADLFIKGNAGVGINSSYTGTVGADTWARITLTVQDNGNGTSTLSKYIDGALVGTQSMPTARYTVDAETGFVILSDNDGEVNTGYLSQFALNEGAMSAADVAAMGGVGGALSDTLLTLDFGITPPPSVQAAWR